MSARPSLGDWITALPDLGMAAFCALVWVAPGRVGGQAVRYILLVMLLEFIVVHSAGFMGVAAFGTRRTGPLGRLGPAGAIVALGLFYSLFVAGFSAAFHAWWPLGAFWILTANRLLALLVARPADTDEARALIIRGWAAGAVCYLLGAFATTLLPVPRFGITDEVVAAQQLSGGGMWVDQPWRAVAFGVLYFGVVGWSELRAHRWGRARSVPAAG